MFEEGSFAEKSLCIHLTGKIFQNDFEAMRDIHLKDYSTSFQINGLVIWQLAVLGETTHSSIFFMFNFLIAYSKFLSTDSYYALF